MTVTAARWLAAAPATSARQCSERCCKIRLKLREHSAAMRMTVCAMTMIVSVPFAVMRLGRVVRRFGIRITRAYRLAIHGH